jgi:hypothetical protein
MAKKLSSYVGLLVTTSSLIIFLEKWDKWGNRKNKRGPCKAGPNIR